MRPQGRLERPGGACVKRAGRLRPPDQAKAPDMEGSRARKDLKIQTQAMKNPIKAIQKYYDETVEQLKKCTWPSPKELYDSTAVIVTSLVIITVFVMVVDWGCEAAVRFIVGSF